MTNLSDAISVDSQSALLDNLNNNREHLTICETTEQNSGSATIPVRVNRDAYDAIDDLGFEIIDVLQTFGEEVWENNVALYEEFTCKEVATAFIQHILDQSCISERFKPVFFSKDGANGAR